MSNLYRHADQALKLMYQFIEQEFQRTASTARWDELNVMRTTDELFKQIDTYVQWQLRQIAQKAYEDAKREIIAVLPEKEQNMPGIATAFFVMAVLRSYNGKTQYRYDREWERKRDRLAESVMAVIQQNELAKLVNSNEVREALQRSMRLMQGQVREMADTMTDEARNEAFKQAGIDEVMWHDQNDSKVCKECRERDGQIYSIYNVPSKHPHCRCWLSAVIRDQEGSE